MNRKKNKEYLIAWFRTNSMPLLLDKLEESIDESYIEGYNTVLNAAERVLSEEDYMKIVRKLEQEE